MNINKEHASNIKERFADGISANEILSAINDDLVVENGLWRFYSGSWPIGGIKAWNRSESPWRLEWRDSLSQDAIAFGEDIFGNQLIINKNNDVYFLNHENFLAENLYCSFGDLFQIIEKNGIDWISHYEDGSLGIARKFDSVTRDFHIHWRTPLILGGQANEANVSFVQREPHLVGHAKLWKQIRDLPPGTAVKLS
jgi:hypothetical protein